MVMTDDETPIVVEVLRRRWGHDAKLGIAHVAEGPAYVRRHIDAGAFGDVCAALALGGHAFAVRLKDEQISALEMMGATPAKLGLAR